MRTAWLLPLLVVTAGCSSREEPKAPVPLSASEAPAMPIITLEEVKATLAKPEGKALLMVLWRAEADGTEDALAAADAMAARHAKDGLKTLALNIDMPDAVREQALPLLETLGLKSLEARAYQDDVMGLGMLLDASWGGQVPAAFVYDAKGAQRYKARGKDAVGGAAGAVTAALAGG